MIQFEASLFLISTFVLGMVRGASICAVVCAPGMIPYLVMKKCSWQECLRLGLIFNLPRIILLTILGMIVGALSYTVVNLGAVEESAKHVGVFGYFLLALFLLGFGAYTLARAIDEKADRADKEGGISIKACRKNRKSMIKDSRFSKKVLARVSNPSNLFLLWGGILSLACISEIILIEGLFVGSIGGAFGRNVYGGMLLGGAAMFSFAVGTAIPILIVTMIGGTLSYRIKSFEKLSALKTIGAMVMIMIGLVFIFVSIANWAQL